MPLPIIMRKVMRHISAPELRVLIYLQTRCSRHCICFPAIDEMAHDLGMGSGRNLTPHINELVKKKFIATATGSGKKYFLVHDPRIAIRHLVETGTINENELFEINELLGDLGQDSLVANPKPQSLKVVPKPIREADPA